MGRQLRDRGRGEHRRSGVAIWEQFKDRLEAIALRRYGAGGVELAGSTSLSHQFDITNGEAFALRTLKARQYSRAARKTAAVLGARFGSADVATWREPRRMYEVMAQGAGSSPDLPFFDRGTWEQSVALGR